MSAVKDLVGPAVDRLGDELESVSRLIHEHPELGYQEVQAAGWLSDFLERQGFKVERGVACLLYTSPSPRDRQKSRMPSSA